MCSGAMIPYITVLEGEDYSNKTQLTRLYYRWQDIVVLVVSYLLNKHRGQIPFVTLNVSDIWARFALKLTLQGIDFRLVTCLSSSSKVTWFMFSKIVLEITQALLDIWCGIIFRNLRRFPREYDKRLLLVTEIVYSFAPLLYIYTRSLRHTWR